ncbi:YlbF family regulator [Loigolactobacillus jiayinensis]|uniref:YlbF family regulator n=1 Tax=Loigolactobacillus jiayinensis TaxID=2486016 RepID=A0ABW1RIK8_9LACO|nr:YlbF family regulator [Loigolactobacillus jiayinensis]
MASKSHLDEQTQAALTQLCQLLKNDETVHRYQTIEHQVKHNTALNQLQQDLETAQKAIVNDDHYEKPKAAIQAAKQADQLKAALEQNPLTVAYRSALFDANATLEMVTDELQRQVDQLIEQKQS